MIYITLWTIQPAEIYEQIINTGSYSPDPALMDDYWFPSYDWLCKHLEVKSSKPEGVSYPVWAWHTFNGKRKKPDLRYSGYSNRGDKMVLFQIQVPDDEVLLSDFSNWHFVLNNWWMDPMMFNEDYTEEEYDKNNEWFKSLSAEEKREELEKSWLKIFDIEPFESDWVRKGFNVQAIFWELKAEYIKRVQFFTAK